MQVSGEMSIGRSGLTKSDDSLSHFSVRNAEMISDGTRQTISIGNDRLGADFEMTMEK
jgi:hypothetical protein